MNKRFLLVLALCVLGLGTIFFLTKDKASAPNGKDNNSKVSNHVFGKGKSGVTLFEYGDFQCPACASYFPMVKQIEARYENQITCEFRNSPLPIHKNAFAAHRAAEAADMQGKFWDMHDLLYENQNSWSESSGAYSIFESFAKSLGLDLVKFKSDFASAEVNDIINADKKAGEALGADSTPTFILDGKKIEPLPSSLEEFAKLIDDAIAAKNR